MAMAPKALAESAISNTPASLSRAWPMVPVADAVIGGESEKWQWLRFVRDSLSAY